MLAKILNKEVKHKIPNLLLKIMMRRVEEEVAAFIGSTVFFMLGYLLLTRVKINNVCLQKEKKIKGLS
jgi:hypothetical protein